MRRASLRAWLRREPVPAKCMVRLEDGDEKEIAIPGDLRNRWKTVEASINSVAAVAVNLYDKKGALLRGQDLDPEPDEDEHADTPAAAAEVARGRALRELADVLKSVMHEQNVSFDKGKDAASQSQEHLVGLVDTLAAQFATALTNVHTIVSNMAVLQQQHAQEMAKLTRQLAAADGGDQGSNALDKFAENVVPMLVADAMSKRGGGGGGQGGAPAGKAGK